MTPTPSAPLCLSLSFSALLCCTLLFSASISSYAQHDGILSETEVEQIRDANQDPPARILVYQKILDKRTKRIDDLLAKRRAPGREEDIHDIMEQFVTIADELDDNLDDYATKHLDTRKALPKLLEALERWATALKQPPEHSAYSVERKIALETVADLRSTATKLLAEQNAWFLAHPPAKPKEQPPRGYELPQPKG